MQLRTGAAAIAKALQEPLAMDFDEQPLSDVVDHLEAACHIAIVLDEKSLCDVGITRDTPVTKHLPRMPLRRVLNLTLRDLSLTWIIQDDVLLITTAEKADESLTTTVLDVSDLVVCRDEHDAFWDDYDTLIDAITSTVSPTSWNSGSIKGLSAGGAKVLVVAQTREVQEEVAKLLADIREVAKKNPNAAPPRRDRQPPKPHEPIGSVGRWGRHSPEKQATAPVPERLGPGSCPPRSPGAGCPAPMPPRGARARRRTHRLRPDTK